MKVLFASPYLFPQGGGLERYAHAMATRLSGRGHDVVMLGHAARALDERRDGMRIVGVEHGARLSNTPVGLEVGRAARRILREEGVDVVNVHTPVPGTAELVAWAAARERVPVVVTYHAGRLEGPGLLGVAARLHSLSAQRWLISRAAARIAVSPYVAERVFGARESVVVPPGVDADRFRPVGAPVPGRILFVGPVDRAYAWKGLAVLLRAFGRVASEMPGATLRIVGDGDLVDAYRAHHADLPIEFVPRVSDDALPVEYSRASVVVLPSLTPAESFGMVLAEANACGRPVVGSDVGGIPSFVRPGENGLLARPGDESSLAASILAILQDPRGASRMGAAGRERVLRHHRWEDLAQSTEAVLTEACGRGAGRTPAG